MRLRECDNCEEQISVADLVKPAGATWVEISDGRGWVVDACGATCAQAVLIEHLQEVTELAVVR